MVTHPKRCLELIDFAIKVLIRYGINEETKQ